MEKIKRRSWLAQSAKRSGAGPHKDSRKKREGTRRQKRDAAKQDGY